MSRRKPPYSPTKVVCGPLSSPLMRIALRSARAEISERHRRAMAGEDTGLVAMRDTPEYKAEVERVMQRIRDAIKNA